MFADSSGKFQLNVQFQVKFRFNLSNGRQKGQAHAVISSSLGRCGGAAKSLTCSHLGSRGKALQTKHVLNLNLFKSLLAESQELLGLLPCRRAS